jgi:hypothetical protein
MTMEFSTQHDSSVQHFFITSNAGDLEVADEIGGVDPAVDEPDSITRFLTLPTVTRQRHTKIRDPIFDFAQSKILTSEEYSTAADEMRLAKEMAEQAKAQQRCEKQTLKRRKAVEREEGRLAKAAAREEAARLKELCAAQQAELQAACQALREEAQRVHMQRVADAASAKAAEKAQKALERQKQQRLRIARAAEMAQGSQGGGTSANTIGKEPEVIHSQIHSSIPEHPAHFLPPQNIPYFFSPSPGFSPMPSSTHLSFPQLNTPMQSTQPSHPILQYSSPFQVFQNSLQQTPQWAREMSDQLGPMSNGRAR